MKTSVYISTLIIIGLFSSLNGKAKTETNRNSSKTITKIEMNLSVFGVESEDFPSIEAVIDFSKDSSICVKSFYNPANKGSTYSLTK